MRPVSPRHQGGHSVLRRTRAIALTVGGLVGAIFAMAPAATATTDSTTPHVEAQPWASFVPGSQISTDTPNADGVFFSRVLRTFAWTASDDSGTLCDSAVNREFAGAPTEEAAHGVNLRSFTDTTTDYDDQFGGGSFKLEDWQISATDCSDNIAYGYTQGSKPRVTQDDNVDGAWGFTDASIVYSRHWWTNNVPAASGGTMHETGWGGARATITSTFIDGQHVGLVMAQGPRDGSAAVYVDGQFFQTVDTHATQWRPRVVVFDATMTAGTHTIRLVNLASAGHPHLQLDAVLTDD